MMLVGVGVAVGGAGAAALSRFVSHLLFGVEARDISTLVAAALLLAIVGFVASYIPAARATRVDPMLALRAE
jgi:ABC-type lipoprotein release transport system permease subunit